VAPAPGAPFNPAAWVGGQNARAIYQNADPTINIANTVDSEGVASDQEEIDTAQRILLKLAVTAGAPIDNATMASVVDQLLLLIAHNGTTKKFAPRGFFHFNDANGMAHVVRQALLLECPLPDIRRWARKMADRTREVIRVNNVITRWGQNHGIKPIYFDVAFDTAEFCRNPALTPIEKEVLSSAKRVAVNSAPQDELMDAAFSTTRDPTPQVHGHIHLGPGAGATPTGPPGQRRLL
jgi:hypothetical protein